MRQPPDLPWWRVPRCFEGETVAILGGGPSLTMEQVNHCAGRCRVVAINRAYLMAPWADWLYGADAGWFWAWCGDDGSEKLKSGEPSALDFTGTRIVLWSPDVPVPIVARLPALVARGVKVLRHRGDGWHTGLDPDPSWVRGNNSGYSAVNAAIHAGAKRILLLGMDGRGRHWHSGWPLDQPKFEDPCPERPFRASIQILGRDVELGWFKSPDEARLCEARYRRNIADGCPIDQGLTGMLPRWATLITPLAERGVEVVNCSPGSAIKAFPMAKLQDVL